MTYELKIEQKPTYLRAVVTGRNSKENVSAYMQEIGRACAARGCFRVLIEERLDGPRLGTMDVFEIVSEGVRRAKGMKAIAYVDVHAKGDSMHFAETIAVNRFLPVAVFSTIAEAVAWITRGGGEEGTES